MLTQNTIYWFAYYNQESPSVRYRAVYPLQFIEKNFATKVRLCFPGYSPKRVFTFLKMFLFALFDNNPHSIIVIQRVHSNWIYANALKILIKLSSLRSVYDLDDADYLEHPPKNITYFLRKTTMNFIGSIDLLEYSKKYNPKGYHLTSPTVPLGISKNGKNDTLKLGWIGCYGGDHEKVLKEEVYPAILQINTPLELCIIGVTSNRKKDEILQYFQSKNNLIISFPQPNWQNEKEIQQLLSTIDLGLAPLINNELHRCKSAFKLKQYLNNGIPVLSSQIGENSLFIKHGVNGFYCHGTNDYKTYIEFFTSIDSSEYADFSKNSLLSSKEFSLHSYTFRIQEIIRREMA